MISNAYFIDHLTAEADFARKKFPGNAMIFVALIEEVGELAKALNEQRQGVFTASNRDIYAEAVQVASTAMRLATEGDLDYPDYSPDMALDSYESFEIARAR